jgi:hypothetical protein
MARTLNYGGGDDNQAAGGGGTLSRDTAAAFNRSHHIIINSLFINAKNPEFSAELVPLGNREPVNESAPFPLAFLN